MKIRAADIIAHCRRHGLPVPQVRTAHNPNPIRSEYRSKLEADYAARLEGLRWAGEIQAWAYEPLRFGVRRRWEGLTSTTRRVGFYVPDFLVLLPCGQIVAHEVKGYQRRHDRQRHNSFVDYWPAIPLFIVTRVRGGVWVVRRWGQK